MPRKVTIPTRELGELSLYVIYEKAGSYEPSWAPVQGKPFTDGFSRVSIEVWTHALKGWTHPLVKALGLPPEGAIRKLLPIEKTCEAQSTCPLFTKGECTPLYKKMPWCFQPGGLDTLDQRRLGAEAIQMWRDKTYIVVVFEP